jgi:serine/threonine protein kinase
MNNKSDKHDKHRTIFGPDLATGIGLNRNGAGSFTDSALSQTWLSRRASQESSNTGSRNTVKMPLEIRKFDENPFKDYELCYQTQLAGPVDVCINRRSKKVVIIKKVERCSKMMLHQLKATAHENIVHFSTSYYWKESIHLVYERMVVTLGEITVTPRGRMPDPAIASASLSILKGLRHIHGELKMSHGAINADNILLNLQGQIKIGKA